jgi:superfamily I DNA and RNA helicase
MNFYPFEAVDSLKGQGEIWRAVKLAFSDEPGYAYYRYPVHRDGAERHLEPDVLVVHPEHGAFVLEVKGFRIKNLERIDGQAWQMRDFYSETITPVSQAEDQAFAVKSRLERKSALRGVVGVHARVVLPFIDRAEWLAHGFENLAILLFRDDLEPNALRAHLRRATNPQGRLSEAQLQLVQDALGNGINRAPPPRVPTDAPLESPVRVMSDLARRFATLDDQQIRALQNPPGPQRLRGIAGSGKTVLLAKRAARLALDFKALEALDGRARHVAFVFFSKSLYDEVRHRIASEHRAITDDGSEPDWTRLEVLHAWGGKTTGPGFYYALCQHWSQPFLNAGRSDFAGACADLESRTNGLDVPPRWDAIFVDEGQDLPFSFYRLARRALHRDEVQTERLYWAYDEAQSLEQLAIPEASEVFGRAGDGAPLVNLSGVYLGGALKSITMRHCYRTPKNTLMVAHAVGMGLLRAGGPVQGLTTREAWDAIGYRVVAGNFNRVGEPVRLERPAGIDAHPLDTDADLRARAERVAPLLVVCECNSERDERSRIAASVKRDLERGFAPEDVAVVALPGPGGDAYIEALRVALEDAGVPAFVAVDRTYRKSGAVTISQIYRAKGNEASRVYACRFEHAHAETMHRNELQARNAAFVALTRSRIWTVALSAAPAPVLTEIEQALEQAPYLEFPAFNRASLRRHYAALEGALDQDALLQLA